MHALARGPADGQVEFAEGFELGVRGLGQAASGEQASEAALAADEGERPGFDRGGQGGVRQPDEGGLRPDVGPQVPETERGSASLRAALGGGFDLCSRVRSETGSGLGGEEALRRLKRQFVALGCDFDSGGPEPWPQQRRGEHEEAAPRTQIQKVVLGACSQSAEGGLEATGEELTVGRGVAAEFHFQCGTSGLSEIAVAEGGREGLATGDQLVASGSAHWLRPVLGS